MSISIFAKDDDELKKRNAILRERKQKRDEMKAKHEIEHVSEKK